MDVNVDILDLNKTSVNCIILLMQTSYLASFQGITLPAVNLSHTGSRSDNFFTKLENHVDIKINIKIFKLTKISNLEVLPSK